MQISELAVNQLPKTKEKLWNLNFILICLSTLSIYIAFHSMIPTLPIYIEQLGGSKNLAGLPFALLTIAAVLIRPVTGWALDNYGRKIILAAGLLLYLIPSFIFISMIGIIPLLIFRLFQGFGWGILNTSQATIASDVIPSNRLGEGLGFFGISISISLTISPAIGLWLVDNFSFQTLFVFSSLLVIISLLLALNIKYPKQVIQPSKTKLVFFEKLALRPALIILLVTVTYSSLLSFLALFIRQIGLTTAGLFFTAMAITTLITRPLSGTLVDKKGRLGYDFVVLTGLATVILSMVILSHTTASWHLILGGILFGIGFGFLAPTMLALSISCVPSVRRGAANATYWTAFDIGIASGSILGGIIAQHLGFWAMFNLNIIPPLAAMVIYLFYRKSIPA